MSRTSYNVAFIAEDACIGCGKCLPACPVDAIVGAPKYMHTVLSDECTGCELCIPVCPVDCIPKDPEHEETKQQLMEKYKNANAAVVMSVQNTQTQTFQIELETSTDYVNLEFDTNGKILKEQKQPLSNDEMQRQEEEGVEKN